MNNLKDLDFWKKLFSSYLFSICLSLIAVVFLVGIIFFTTKTINNNKEINSQIEEINNTLQSDLLPSGYQSPTPTISQESLDSSDKTSSTKTALKPKASNQQLPEKSSNTLDGRDKDRRIIIEQMANFITEYNFEFDKMPELYADKSETSLSVKESTSIYFYNGKENKSNAMGITLSSESYTLKQVSSCQNNYSKENNINFVYSKEVPQLLLCRESGSDEVIIIL